MKNQELRNKEICIYCMGKYGIRLCYVLMKRGYIVKYFGDINAEKCGYAMSGIMCISYDKVCELNKDKTVVIVAKQNPERLIYDFKEKGFTVYSYSEIMDRLEGEQKASLDGNRFCNIEEVQGVLNAIKETCYSEKKWEDVDVIESSEYARDVGEDIGQMLKDYIKRRQYEGS